MYRGQYVTLTFDHKMDSQEAEGQYFPITSVICLLTFDPIA